MVARIVPAAATQPKSVVVECLFNCSLPFLLRCIVPQRVKGFVVYGGRCVHVWLWCMVFVLAAAPQSPTLADTGADAVLAEGRGKPARCWRGPRPRACGSAGAPKGGRLLAPRPRQPPARGHARPRDAMECLPCTKRSVLCWRPKRPARRVPVIFYWRTTCRQHNTCGLQSRCANP